MSGVTTAALGRLAGGEHLTQEDAYELFTAIMSGAATGAQIGGVLMALKVRGETIDEITGAAEAMRALATRVPVSTGPLIDTCGTGGSGPAKLFNISTAAAIAAAAAGARVAKHGNRGMSSKSGSADVLEAAGVNLALAPADIGRCIDEAGVGFMLAPAHHGAMKHAIGPRRELGVHTLFNLLGPLTNPAGAERQLLGVFDACWQKPLAEVLAKLGSRHVLVVHADGLDELTVAGESRVVELKDGKVREYAVRPEDVGLDRHELTTLKADSVAASLTLVRDALTGENEAARAIVALNAGAAIYVAGLARSLKAGVDLAQEAIAAGLAIEKLDHLARITRAMGTS